MGLPKTIKKSTYPFKLAYCAYQELYGSNKVFVLFFLFLLASKSLLNSFLEIVGFLLYFLFDACSIELGVRETIITYLRHEVSIKILVKNLVNYSLHT